ncbi:MAG: hypothetical protein ACW975_13495 [Candidatus Thorarchaeota archaeon]
MANTSHDPDIFSEFIPEKRARFQAYDKVHTSLGTPSQSLFVLDNDNEVDIFQRDFNEFLTYRGHKKSDSHELPYHVVRIGYDGDMLDDMFRLVVSEASDKFEPAKLDVSMLLACCFRSRQSFSIFTILSRKTSLSYFISRNFLSHTTLKPRWLSMLRIYLT